MLLKDVILLLFSTTSFKIIDLVVLTSKVSNTFLESELFVFPPPSIPVLKKSRILNPNLAFNSSSLSLPSPFVTSLALDIMLLSIIFISYTFGKLM